MPKIISHKQKVVPSNTDAQRVSDPNNLHFLLTCQSGLESLVKRECERIGVSDIHALDRLVKCRGDMKSLYELLIWNRFANRVYLSLAEERVTDFDALHDVVRSIDWGSSLTGKELIVVEASSTRSILSSVPTIQSISQNALFSTITTPNYTNDTEVHVLILIIDDIAHILLDVTGDPLHKRGYRRDSGEAPMKENLAASLLAFANWKYKSPLLDPFCGSGTIAIEAAMMARNIAPGLFRSYRIEELPLHNTVLLESVRANAEKKIYPSGGYTIHASDIDPAMVQIARENARRAGVAEDIVFSVADFLHHTNTPTYPDSVIITNPPYGNRLQSDDLDEIYTKILSEIQSHGGGCITTYRVDIRYGLANRKLLNGGEECRFWYKKG